MQRDSVTMKDVAREAGLAVGTVSNYINGKKSVKPKNQARIEDAIKVLGYEVNEVARNLKMKSSKTVGIIIPSFSNVFAVNTISHLEEVFRSHGYNIQACSFNHDEGVLDEVIHSLVMKRVDGLIIMPDNSLSESVTGKLDRLVEQGIPVVFFDYKEAHTGCDHVVLNNYQVMRDAAASLLVQGHRDIALFLGPENISSSKERLSGYVDALKEFGIDMDERLIIHTDYTKSMSRSSCNTLLGSDLKVSAILTAGYRITLGVLSSVSEQGLSIPDDISVIGFDTHDISDVLPYGLSGVSIPTVEVADAIAMILLGRFSGTVNDETVTKTIELQFTAGHSVTSL